MSVARVRCTKLNFALNRFQRANAIGDGQKMIDLKAEYQSLHGRGSV